MRNGVRNAQYYGLLTKHLVNPTKFKKPEGADEVLAMIEK